ncbi:MAG: alpha/beta fold hydrolase [Brevundimonas sp.]|uniref:alpha/beta fold hydrolase n=1 Tax=Brevundimonas sp. TaxID=1871086 RepID=UPI00273359FC|nr:alpha/beta fold hydrolase [Brevundimonas sp.]MDP3377432.1 alpha/beta fold hydrolase [Brevundimonas sp.]
MMRFCAALFLILVLSGCTAPYVQTPLLPPERQTLPQMADASFIIRDGAVLPYLHWMPDEAEPWAVIVALHGINDSRAAFRLAGPWWAERGIATYAYDQRGFGDAPGRGLWPGGLMADDLDQVVALVRARHPDALIAVAGESMGGAVAITAFASDAPPAADRLILLAPAVWGWSSQPLLYRLSLSAAAWTFGDVALEPPAWAADQVLPSDHLMELIRSGRDPDQTLSTRFDVLYGLVNLMEAAGQELGQIRVPTLFLYGARDDLVPDQAVRQALERAGPMPGLRTVFYEDGYHLLNRDLQAVRVFADIEAWLRHEAAALPSGAGPIPLR